MWDDAKMLQNMANALFTLCMLLGLYGLSYRMIHAPELLPLKSVRLETVPVRVEALDVLRIARRNVQGNLLTVNIDRVRESLEKLPWVRSVSIRREFPDRLVVGLEEHQVLARWNDSLLINGYGEVFAAKAEQKLPKFQGPEGSASEVATNYDRFSSQLGAVGLEIEGVSLSERHAWLLNLSDGVVVELGREDIQGRLARFVEVYPYSLAIQAGKFKYVDLRYRNGFAVSGLMNQG